MKGLKEKITDDLMREIGIIGKKIDQISNMKTAAEMAEFASDGSLGCPSYYGLPHEGCKNPTPAKCKRCWLKALNASFDTTDK